MKTEAYRVSSGALEIRRIANECTWNGSHTRADR